MRVMTDPQSGTRQFRIETARAALASWRAWTENDEDITPPFSTFGELASCARWLLEALEPAGPADSPDTLGAANLAVAHLDMRGMRDVLNLLAMRRPGAVLAAIAEAGH